MITWIASFPRSGNTFFRMLLYYQCGISTASIHGDPNFESMGATETIGQIPMPMPLEECHAAKETFFIKTHDLPCDDSPSIYLVRDGRDVMVSYTHYQINWVKKRGLKGKLHEMLGRNRFEKVFRRTLQHQGTSEDWSHHVQSWLKHSSKPPYLVRYEDLVKDPDACISRLRDAFGIKSSHPAEQPPSFEELNRQWPQFFRKGRQGSWKDEMTPELEALFWERHGQTMTDLGYER
jgi:hypothetical protein